MKNYKALKKPNVGIRGTVRINQLLGVTDKPDENGNRAQRRSWQKKQKAKARKLGPQEAMRAPQTDGEASVGEEDP